MAQVKCVYGAPCSGKSSYVREHFKDGDIAWDYDEIKRTITLKSIHSKGSRNCAILSQKTARISTVIQRGSLLQVPQILLRVCWDLTRTI